MKININLKNIIKYLILFVLACILIYYSNIVNVKAYTVSNGSIYTCDINDNVTSGTYNYILDGVSHTGYFGTTYQGVMSTFSTSFNAQIQQGNTYTLELNANTGDWRNININSIQEFGSIGSHCSDNLNAYTVTSVVSTYYKITITFIANSTSNYSKLVIYNSNGNAITGISNFKIDSMALTDLGNTNTSDIINNQQQNTQDIIENDKQNTQDIIDNNDNNTQDIIDNQDKNNEELKEEIKENFNTCYTNIFDAKSYISNTFSSISVNNNDVTVSATSVWKTLTYNFDVSPGEQYTLYYEGDDTIGVYYYIYGPDNSVDYKRLINSTFTVVVPETNTLTIRLQNKVAGTTTFGNLLLVKGVTSTFIPYGQEVCSNKLDGITGGLNDLNENQQATNDKLDEQIQQDKEQHEEQMESQQVCNLIDKSNIKSDNKVLNAGGVEETNNNFGITDYIDIKNNKVTILSTTTNGYASMCFYNINKEKLSCQKLTSMTTGEITATGEQYYIRSSIDKNVNRPSFEVCVNGNQALNDSLNNSDTSGANQDANNFFNNFENNDFGLSDIITLPLTTIQSITSKSCTPLSLTLPFVNKTFELPCMNTIYSKFEPFYSIYQTITFGVISYWVCVQIYAMVKGFKDPTSDEIEVMDL